MVAPRKKLRTVGIAIREFRQQAELSQDGLADRMDVSASYISMLENGGRYPSIEMRIRIALAMGVRPGALLDRIAQDVAPGAPLSVPPKKRF
jgi:transcriptional regulator with XRE-family HTH domain